MWLVHRSFGRLFVTIVRGQLPAGKFRLFDKDAAFTQNYVSSGVGA